MALRGRVADRLAYTHGECRQCDYRPRHECRVMSFTFLFRSRPNSQGMNEFAPINFIPLLKRSKNIVLRDDLTPNLGRVFDVLPNRSQKLGRVLRLYPVVLYTVVLLRVPTQSSGGVIEVVPK